MIRVTFLLGMSSHARYWKRITALKQLGVEPKVLAFERNHYAGRELPEYCTVLGRTSHGNYLRRLVPLARALSHARKACRNADAIYAFDLDMAILGTLAMQGVGKPQRLIYEIGDIRGIKLAKNMKGRVVRSLERFILKRTSLLVSTSPDYIEGYYNDILGVAEIPHLIIENKLDSTQLPRKSNVENPKRSESVLRIGYFGVLRCSQSWEILKKAVRESNGKIEVFLRGVPMGVDQLVKEAEEIPGIEYGGPYVSPRDLAGMYGQVDIVWACYPYQGKTVGNWSWARTTRFYESCFFGKPLIAQTATADARVVETFDIGLCLDLADIDKAASQLLELKPEDLRRWQQNLERVPEEVYVYKDEHQKLIERMSI